MNDPDWEAIKCFVAVARLGSFTNAGRDLGVSIATVARRIGSLEEVLGLKLLKRSSAGAVLTDAGAVVLEHAQPGARHLAQITRAARALRSGPAKTPIRISSTEPMISEVLATRVTPLLEANPDLEVEFDVSNALSNLNSGEADMAVRLADPKSPTLIAQRLPPIRLALYCSRGYLNRRPPESLSLRAERLLWLDVRYGPIPENAWISDQGLEATVRLRSSSVRALLRAVEADAGIAPLPAFIAVARGLVEVPSPALPKRQPWLVFHRDTRDHKRMKAVRAWVVDCCRDALK